ncbi:MAG: Holliday junction resolvase RuvX [Dehalococcoidia bacterium]|nr:Holliday junction resolvase RuvX [Dehalococcoidia bacterium]|tara:strand:+ start:2252 stop:2671 length:420 start_codon:yes stop_codon:yes gene_type:complete
MRIMGLDLGSRRIGIAIGDSITGFAFPSDVIFRKDEKADISAILSQIKKNQIGQLVIGMPISMNGKKGQQAEATLQFIGLLKKQSTIDIQTWDERLTTVEANRRLREAGSGKIQKGTEDAVAASILLQAFLDSQRSYAL